MFKFKVCISHLVFFLVAACASSSELVPYDASTLSFAVNIEQAKASIATWAGDSTIDATLRGVILDTCGAPVYYFDAPGQNWFLIDCSTGEIVKWRDSQKEQDFLTQYSSKDHGSKLDLNSIRQIAFTYARSHYADFAQLNLQP